MTHKEIHIRGEPVIVRFVDARDNIAVDSSWKVISENRHMGKSFASYVDNVAKGVDEVERRMARYIEEEQAKRQEYEEAEREFKEAVSNNKWD